MVSEGLSYSRILLVVAFVSIVSLVIIGGSIPSFADNNPYDTQNPTGANCTPIPGGITVNN